MVVAVIELVVWRGVDGDGNGREGRGGSNTKKLYCLDNNVIQGHSMSDQVTIADLEWPQLRDQKPP